MNMVSRPPEGPERMSFGEEFSALIAEIENLPFVESVSTGVQVRVSSGCGQDNVGEVNHESINVKIDGYSHLIFTYKRAENLFSLVSNPYPLSNYTDVYRVAPEMLVEYLIRFV